MVFSSPDVNFHKQCFLASVMVLSTVGCLIVKRKVPPLNELAGQAGRKGLKHKQSVGTGWMARWAVFSQLGLRSLKWKVFHV